ncbi:hypothetical protein [Caulobacter sp. SSI4214]|uniref:hypothetical protein n=1 Tax=Caulobacter sp. SSI4214 TaxID=2575739 RepID=UPI00143C6CDD|nr:hypothetical protein [Caulobacter sp. SSI4214]
MFSQSEQNYVRKLRKRPVNERIALAEEKVRGLWDYIIDVCKTHENSRIIVRSDRLSSQLPPSHAAHSFTNLQRCVQNYEIIRLAALWDGPKADRLSIPTVIALVGDLEVLRALYKRRLLQRRAEEAGIIDESDPELAALFARPLARAARDTTRSGFHRDARQGLLLGIKAMNSARRVALAEFRHRNIAHNLTVDPVRLRAGQIDRLLHTTTVVGNGLYGLVLRSGFAIEDSRVYARRCAESLWRNCSLGRIEY